MEILIFIALISLGFFLYFLDRRRNKELKFINKMNSINDELNKILVGGLYHRFKHEEGKEEDTPWDFEEFVGNVIEQIRGGTVKVTQKTNDGGIDLIHLKDDGLYLGQVKCYAPNSHKVDYEPIAILHSQMVKHNAKGGFLVTTSIYNDNAISYAEGLNIELIDGKHLLQMWLQMMEETQKTYIPADQITT
jgi:restriction system protein